MESDESRGPWMETYTGRKFYPFTPTAFDIDIRDIAHHLAMECRFAGAVSEFYSVAQHSVLAYRLCGEPWGLLHDAAEAYLKDLPRPVKERAWMLQSDGETFEHYRDVERRVQAAVATRFGLTLPMPEVVKAADNVLLVTERRDLMPVTEREWGVDAHPDPVRIVPWTWQVAESEFLFAWGQVEQLLKRSAE